MSDISSASLSVRPIFTAAPSWTIVRLLAALVSPMAPAPWVTCGSWLCTMATALAAEASASVRTLRPRPRSAVKFTPTDTVFATMP